MSDNFNISGGIILSVLIFILNPIAGILFSIILTIQQNRNKYMIICLISLISIFLGLINTTKVLQSDIISYANEFHLAKQLSIKQFVLLAGKAPVFYFFMYLISNILKLKFSFFVFFQTFVVYEFFLLAIYKFYDKLKESIFTVLFAISLGTLFFVIFSLSAHLMRQFLATTVFLYYLVEYTLNDKNKLWLLLIALFTHATVFLFLPFIFLTIFKKKATLKTGIIIIIAVISGSLIFRPMILFFSNHLPLFLSYGFKRLLEGHFVDLTGNVKSITIIVNSIMLFLILYLFFFAKDINFKLYHFFNIFISLIIFTLLTLDAPLLSYRFSFYIYFIFPFIIPLILKKSPIRKLSFVIQVIIIFFLIVRFGYKLTYGTFRYESIEEVVFKSAMYYIL